MAYKIKPNRVLANTFTVGTYENKSITGKKAMIRKTNIDKGD